MRFRTAGDGDVEPVVDLVQSAYRGPESTVGWTTEADLLDGRRTDAAAISALTQAGELLLAETATGELLGCCQVELRRPTAYFGTFAVRPELQGRGTGSALLAEAERRAAEAGARTLAMTVIHARTDLIPWYERRGYAPTGETKPFPYGDERFGLPRRDDLHFVVLAKELPVPPPVPGPAPRADLAEALARRALLADDARPGAVARRHESGRLTTRECLALLLDPGSFVEYAGLAVAAQRARRGLDDLIHRTQGDGVVGGVGRIDGRPVAVLSYDYLVLAGTQGAMGHKKTDRLLEVVARQQLPIVLFAEGGGGRPGDTDVAMVAGLDVMTFRAFAALPTLKVGVAGGYCFAGNAALFGMCDVTIAVAGASIGMGGPAMIAGGGLGDVAPGDVGPVEVHERSGVLDAVAPDDAGAVALARQAVGYALGPATAWSAADQAALRDVVPENRRRAYDVRTALRVVVDEGSTFELAPRHARGMVTALARLEGRPLGVLANNPLHLAGAVTAEGADKAARFLDLCGRHDLPLLCLCDTPGIMVGPDAERTGLVRSAGRMFTAAAADLRMVTVVLRKGYGLGAMAMAGGSFRAPLTTVAWPSGEFGGMNLEGAVRLGLRRELAAIADEAERERFYAAAVAAAYEQGKALSMATYVEIDDVIDPADTRALVAAVLWP